MNLDWLSDPRTRALAAAPFTPPLMIEESVWDILLALREKGPRGIAVDELSARTSVSNNALNQWLTNLEGHQLVAGVVQDGVLIVLMTSRGHALLDRYLCAVSELQTIVRH